MRKKSLTLLVTLHVVLIAMFSSVILLTSCKSKEEKQKERETAYYLNEDFILVNAKEDIVGGDNGNAYKVRTWMIMRVIKEYPDSIQQAEIISKVATNPKDDCNCRSKDFIITNELWYSKPVGSTLHFDHIRKDRFFKLPAIKVPVVEQPAVAEPTVVGDGDKMQVELEILKHERELTTLKEKLKTYENN